MQEKEYKLTEQGRKECEKFINELKAKRKDILDTGIDEDGEIYNGYGVTDHYDTDRVFGLKFGEDFIEVMK